MPDLAMLDYFYGDEAEQFTFYRIPKVLFTDPSYRRISSDAKILYGLMLDRMGLSVRNGWLDEYNRVFIFFTLEDALEYLCCGHTKAVSLFGELDKAGLIERKKQGQGKPTKIYVKNFVRNAEVLTSEKRKSKVPQSGSQDFQKTASNNTEIKDTELSDTEPSIHPARGLPEDKSPAADAMDTMRVYRQIIMENIEYDITRRQLGYDADILDEIVDIMVDTVCSTKPMIRIGGQDFPLEVVKSRLLKLNSEHPDCAVCQSDRAQCIGKAPDTSTEPEQPTEPDTPTEPEPPAEPEKCTCTDKCAAGAVNTGCEICKNDLTKCEGKEPEVVDPKFTISILAPDGWYTNRANVEIRIKDVNKTSWDTVEAKINSGGSWIDLTDDLVDKDKVSLEISENCTIYVTVTDKNGKSHTKNRYIEVFDREAPTIRAGIEGELLRVEASDDLSGVDKIYVCGNSFSKLNNGTLDIRLKDYADNYEQITIQATDRAGNKSRMTQLNNPYYEEPKKDSDKTSSSPTSPSIPASTVTTPTGGGTGTTLSQSGTGGTASTGQTAKPTGGTISSSNKADTEKDPSAVSPVATEETEDNPFTPDGSATVVDNATDEQGKEFYTIMTPDENVFYLIIDKQRDSENVYFLNAVTESDLMALAQKDTDSQTVTPTAPSEPEPAAPAEPEEPSEPETSEPEPEQPAPKSNNSMMFLVIVAALAAGGLGYYFKVYLQKIFFLCSIAAFKTVSKKTFT